MLDLRPKVLLLDVEMTGRLPRRPRADRNVESTFFELRHGQLPLFFFA
jgi:hypothetical protein